MATIKVKACKDRRVQVEGRAGQYLSETEPTEVEQSHYYQMALRDGDIAKWTDEDEAALAAAAKKAAAEQAAAAKEAEKQAAQQAAPTVSADK